MYKIWGRYDGLVTTDVDVTSDSIPFDDERLSKTICHHIRTKEPLIINGSEIILTSVRFI
jgi:hypothetical protein